MKLGIDDAESLRKKLSELSVDLDFKALGRDVKPFLFKAGDARKIELFPEIIGDTSFE